MIRIFVKITVFYIYLTRFKLFQIFVLLLCLLSDEINTYIKCSDYTCSYTYIVYTYYIFCQFHEIVLIKSFYFMMSLLIYNLTSTQVKYHIEGQIQKSS